MRGLPATIVLRGGYEDSSHPPGWIEGLEYGAGGDWHQPGGAGDEGGVVGEEKRGVHREDIGEQGPKEEDAMEDEEEEEEEETDEVRGVRCCKKNVGCCEKDLPTSYEKLSRVFTGVPRS